MSIVPGVDLSVGPAGLGVLAFRGPDAARFLQGQFSADLEKLAPGASGFAGLHTPQGRVVALLAVARTGDEEFLALLPRELAATVAQRLMKYVLRSKVKIADESDRWRAIGVSGATDLAAYARFSWGTRVVLLVGAGQDTASGDAAAREAWERADIADGLPQVYAKTSESFVAQMLNLDLVGAISFGKGCYTGQEVIARAHYRGRVKRRLQRWQAPAGMSLQPGDSVPGEDGRALTVVRTAASIDGGLDLLAVGVFGPGSGEAEASAGTDAAPRVRGPLPLPYSLPE